MSIDTQWYSAINAFSRATPALHLSAYALWGGPFLLVLLVVGVWWRARKQPEPARAVARTALVGVATVVALLLCQDVVSGLIARPRPCAVIPGAQALLTCSADFSMPSDHAVIGGAIAAGLYCVHRRAAVAATVLAVLLAFARIYAGVHYPSDTLVGLLFGAAISVAIVLTATHPATRAAQRLAPTRAAWIVTDREQLARRPIVAPDPR
jgi:membrane-associated phospholipid phosphatase